MGLLRTLLIILVVYYGLKLVARYVFPYLLKRAVSKVQKNMNSQHTQQEDKSKVGQTTVNYKPKTSSGNSKPGEYIDFEEIDDKKSKED